MTKETEQEGVGESQAPGYNKLPQAEAEEPSAQEASSSAQPDTSLEENQPPEKTSTRYTKLPPMAEDKDAPEKTGNEAAKPEQISEEDEEEDSTPKDGGGGEEAGPEE